MQVLGDDGGSDAGADGGDRSDDDDDDNVTYTAHGTCDAVIVNNGVDVLWLTQGYQGRRPVEAQDALLKGHLLKLTNSFMNPLVSRFAYALSAVCAQSDRPLDKPGKVWDLKEIGKSLEKNVKS